ncbi:hypothetical protein D4R86_00380 [bacterium]|nr:MAG: hypothetical protein D4R86_00380 [bacterium]
MTEEIVKITWEEKPAEIVIGEITWGQKTDCIKKSIKEVQKGRSMKKEADAVLQKELMMIESMISAPFDKTVENLRKLKSKDGERVYSVYSKLNDYDDEDDSEGED